MTKQRVLFDFGWDERKARTNLAKHGVSFRLASTVFSDSLATTIFDEQHSNDEDRGVTLGRARNDQVLVVVHTVEEISVAEMHIPVISALRRPRRKSRLRTSATLSSKG
jgi:uncharacterized DUF497 family protein